MPTKVVLVLLLVLSLAGWYWLAPPQPADTEQGVVVIELNQNVQKNNSSPTLSQQQVQAADQVDRSFNTINDIVDDLPVNSKQQRVLQEIIDRQYSDDAYVELYTLTNIFQMCGDQQVITDWFGSSQGFIAPQQQAMLDGLQLTCQKYQQDYPEVMKLDRRQLAEEFSAESELGQLLQQSRNRGNLSQQERKELEHATMLAALRAENSFVAIESAFSYRFDQQLSSQMTSVINSQDWFYTGQISQLAITQMACEFNPAPACEPEGFLMVVICSQQPDACGMDYSTWFENNTLPGMRQDVALMQAHLFRLSQ